MTNKNDETSPLEAYRGHQEEFAGRFRAQMSSLSGIHEAFQKSFDAQEDFRKSAESILAGVASIRMPSMELPDYSAIAKQAIALQSAIQQAVGPHLQQLATLQSTIQQAIGPHVQQLSNFQTAVQQSIGMPLQQLADLQGIIQRSIGPDLRGLLSGFERLPARTQAALLVLGQHGWYLDPGMPLPGLWELEDALSAGDVGEAEAALVEYFDGRVDEIENEISANFPARGHLIRAAFAAHRRGEYDLAIPVLLSQADGICKETVDQSLFGKRNLRPRTASYVDRIATDTYLAALLSPLAVALPINASERERSDGCTELNRHAVLHGESLDYGTKTNSLKAISLLNYIAYVFSAEIREKIDGTAA